MITIRDIKKIAEELELGDDTIIGILGLDSKGCEIFKWDICAGSILASKNTLEYLGTEDEHYGKPIPDNVVQCIAIWSYQ